MRKTFKEIIKQNRDLILPVAIVVTFLVASLIYSIMSKSITLIIAWFFFLLSTLMPYKLTYDVIKSANNNTSNDPD